MLASKLLNLRHYCSQVTNSYYVTTPIFYVNAAPHIGHLYSAVIADAICRFQQLRHPSANVRLCTGTDEHGTKIQQAAAAHGVAVDRYCDDVSQGYRKTFQEAHIDYSDFIRTTEQRHKDAVSKFWSSLHSSGHIYSSQYSGWYCVSDETFLTDSQLRVDASSGQRFSLESGHPVEWTAETNYMFRLSALQDDVIHWVKQGGRIRPAKFEKILLDTLSESLPDVSVSRPANRVHWAIRVPGDESQTVYVWLDALVNYLTSVGYPDDKYRRHWPPKVQVIGKDILKFHGVYWPAFLIAAGLEPPQQLFVHSHWTVDGQKMSKSKHNVVDPQESSKMYTMEGLRYFLLREGVAHSDGNYSATKALRILNSELADTLGNLLSRGCAKSLNPRQIYPPLHGEYLRELLQTESGERLRAAVQHLAERCEQHYNDNNFYLVVDTVMTTLHAANNFFESSRPWELKSTANGNGNVKKLETIIGITMDTLRLCGIVLQPIVPGLSRRLLDKLNVPSARRLWTDLDENFTGMPTREEESTASRREALPLANIDAVLFRRIVLKDERTPSSPQQSKSSKESESESVTTKKPKATKKSKKEIAQ